MHAVGSIIAIQENKFMVCGYRAAEREDGTVGMGYLLIPYPFGFVNMDSFSLVPFDRTYEVVHEGHRTAEVTELEQLLQGVNEDGRDITAEEFRAAAIELDAELDEELAELGDQDQDEER